MACLSYLSIVLQGLVSMQLTQVKQKVHALWTALILLSVFFGVELSAGLWSHSLSLLADAEHMLSDVAALGLALVATWVSQSTVSYTHLTLPTNREV